MFPTVQSCLFSKQVILACLNYHFILAVAKAHLV